MVRGRLLAQRMKGRKNRPQVGRRIKAQVPTGAHEREVNRRSPTRRRAAHELPIAPTHRDQPERSLAQVIIE